MPTPLLLPLLSATPTLFPTLPLPKARRAIGYSSYNPGPTRATLSWRKGGPVDEEDLVKKKGKKPNGSKREECEEAVELYLEEIPAEKEFVCAVNLAEINRKLGIVMWSPS